MSEQDQERVPDPDATGPTLFETITATRVDAPPENEPTPARKTRLQAAREALAGSQPDKGAEPKGRARKASQARTKRVEPASKKGEFIEPMTDLYVWAGMGMSLFDLRSGHVSFDDNGLPHAPCSEVIIENAPKIAEAWDDLAQKNPAVRRALRSLTTTSVAGQLIVAHAPIALVIMQSHVVGTNSHDHEPHERVDHEADTDANARKE